MQPITEKLLRSGPPGRILRQFEIETALRGTAAGRYGAVNRALAAGELLRLRRGLYLLPGLDGSIPGSVLLAANSVVPGSYISFESALAFNGWIPESVRMTLSACPDRSREVTNAMGVFGYTRIPTMSGRFLEGVESAETGHGTLLVASPLRALADLSYTRPFTGSVRSLLTDSLRIEMSDIVGIDTSAVRSLRDAFRSSRVTGFLEGLLEILEVGE